MAKARQTPAANVSIETSSAMDSADNRPRRSAITPQWDDVVASREYIQPDTKHTAAYSIHKAHNKVAHTLRNPGGVGHLDPLSDLTSVGSASG